MQKYEKYDQVQLIKDYQVKQLEFALNLLKLLC